MLWVECFNESWKRKQNSIANQWLVRDFKDSTTECDSFRSETIIDPDTKLRSKVSVKSVFVKQIFLGGFMSLLFMGIVVSCQSLFILFRSDYEDDLEEQSPYLKYVPSFVNVCLIIIFGQIYTRVSHWLVAQENHRFVFEQEDSLINKIYMFQFVNTYISNFICIFYYQSFYRLQYNMVIVMVFMQLIKNGVEYMLLSCSTSRKINKVNNSFK